MSAHVNKAAVVGSGSWGTAMAGLLAPRAGEAGFEAYLGEMRELFARYERGGVVTLGNRSVAYIGSV